MIYFLEQKLAVSFAVRVFSRSIRGTGIRIALREVQKISSEKDLPSARLRTYVAPISYHIH